METPYFRVLRHTPENGNRIYVDQPDSAGCNKKVPYYSFRYNGITVIWEQNVKLQEVEEYIKLKKKV